MMKVAKIATTYLILPNRAIMALGVVLLYDQNDQIGTSIACADELARAFLLIGRQEPPETLGGIVNQNCTASCGSVLIDG